jgi:hypothetical protein
MQVMPSSVLRFLDHTRCTTVGRTPLVEWSAHHRDLYLTTHNTHNRQTSTWRHTILTTDRPLPDDTTLTTQPCPWQDMNPQSQQARGRSPTHYTPRPMVPADICLEALAFLDWVYFILKTSYDVSCHSSQFYCPHYADSCVK